MRCKANKLEKLVLDKLHSRLKELQETDIEQLLVNREESVKRNLTDSLNRIDRQLKGYETKKSKLLGLLLDEAIKREEFDREKVKIEAEEILLNKERSKMQEIINDNKKQTDAIKILKDLLEMFVKTEDKHVRKEMLHRIIDKILIHRGSIEILYHYGKDGTQWLNVNPRPCGYFGDSKKPCRCMPGAIARYTQRISGPILDRIDIHVDVPSVETQKLVNQSDKNKRETSKEIQKRVQKARDLQTVRFKKTRIKSNSEMSTRDVKMLCNLSSQCRTMLLSAAATMNLSARSYFKVIKITQTIADLEGVKEISINHLAEALQYRPKDSEI